MSELFTVLVPVVFFGVIALAALAYAIHLVAFGRRHGWDSSFELALKLPTPIIRVTPQITHFGWASIPRRTSATSAAARSVSF